MPKHEKGTPKEIANRCKSKGLQKLKWFCQMCQKQCRDQNGFKCHLTSESHQRQLLLFAENQNAYLRQFSREFEANFMHILRHTFGTKRVKANDVYQEYIRDKGHVHMNSTVWHTLTGFILYLGKSGKCRIDENEKGWHIQYIDQEEELRKQKMLQRAKQEKDDEDRMNEQLQRKIERGIEKDSNGDGNVDRELKEFIRNDDSKIAFSLSRNILVKKQEMKPEKVDFKPNILHNTIKPKEMDMKPGTSKLAALSQSKKRSALEEIIAEEEMKKEKQNRSDHWLHTGIIVKIVSSPDQNFLNKKGQIIALIDDFNCKIKIDDGQIVRAHQEQLETVIPALGRDMLVVNGAYTGVLTTLLKVLNDKFAVKLRIKRGLHNERVIEAAYDDASKFKELENNDDS